MERSSDADRAGVQVAGDFGMGTHRVVDPADRPRDLSGWAWCVYVSFGLMAIALVARLVTAMDLHSAVTGGGDILGKYHDYNRWVAIHGLLVLLCAVLFIGWFFQAYKNLRRLGVQNMRFGNGWAIGSWFVPILGMWRPKQMTNDIWRGSERGAEVSNGWRLVPLPSLVHWWWGLFLIQGVLVYIGQTMTEDGYRTLTRFGELSNGFSQLKSGTNVDVIGDIVGIAAVVVAILVVQQITERENEIRDEAIARAPQVPVYAPPADYSQAPPQYPPAPAQYPQSQPPPPPPPVQPAQYAAPPAPQYAAPPQTPTEHRIQCPDCAEWIQAEANVCRFCGHRLRPLGQ
jgi:Domain of unknown function (DUF4328)